MADLLSRGDRRNTLMRVQVGDLRRDALRFVHVFLPTVFPLLVALLPPLIGKTPTAHGGRGDVGFVFVLHDSTPLVPCYRTLVSIKALQAELPPEVSDLACA